MKTVGRISSLHFLGLGGIFHLFGFEKESRLEEAKKYVLEHSGNAGLQSDWATVGNDIRKIMKIIDKKL